MIGNLKEYQSMAAVEDKLWWYKILHKKVLASLPDRIKKEETPIIDAGCGTGGLLLYLSKHGYQDIKGMDLSKDAVEFCHQKDLKVECADLAKIDQVFPKSSADTIICNDVLYFFDNVECEKILQKSHDILKTDGTLILNFPALNSFVGIHDISVGNPGNRYSKKDLKKLINPKLFEVKVMHFWPFFLSPIIYLVRLKQRIQMKLFKKSVEIKYDIDLKFGDKYHGVQDVEVDLNIKK